MSEEIKPVVPVEARPTSASNYQPNSHKSKEALAKGEKSEEPPKGQQITTGNVKVKGPSIWSKIGASFTGDDAQSVGNYLLFDVIIPGTKNIVSDLVTQGIEKALFGGEARPRSSNRFGGGHQTYKPYNRVYGSNPSRAGMDVRPQRDVLSRESRASHHYNDISFEKRQDAAAVMDALRERIDQYGVATVSFFYDLMGLTGNYIDDGFGWFDLEGYGVERVRNEFYLNLPKPESLN